MDAGQTDATNPENENRATRRWKPWWLAGAIIACATRNREKEITRFQFAVQARHFPASPFSECCWLALGLVYMGAFFSPNRGCLDRQALSASASISPVGFSWAGSPIRRDRGILVCSSVSAVGPSGYLQQVSRALTNNAELGPGRWAIGTGILRSVVIIHGFHACRVLTVSASRQGRPTTGVARS